MPQAVDLSDLAKPANFDPKQRREQLLSIIPGATPTSEGRSPARNRKVGGVADSRHLTDDAIDFVPPKGMNWADAMALIRKADPRSVELLDEGTHIHWAPGIQHVDLSDLGPPKPAPAPPKPAPLKPASPKPASAATPKPGLLDDLVGDFTAPIKSAAHEVMEDVRHPGRGRLFPGGPDRSIPDLLGVPLSVAAGVQNVVEAPVTRALAKSPIPIAKPGTTGQYAKTPQEREQAFRGVIDTGLLGLSPAKGGLARIGAEAGLSAEASARVAEARGLGADVQVGGQVGRKAARGGRPSKVPPATPKPTEPAPTGVVGDEKDPVERVDNALYRLGGHNTAGRIEAIQSVRALPKEVRDPKVQEELTHAVEQRMADPNAAIPEHLQAAEAARQPWAERQRVAVNNIRQRLAEKGLTDEEIEAYAPSSETGYVPRRVVGKSPGIDVSEGPTERKSPLAITQGRGRGLGKTTGSLKARDQIVLEDEATGQRRFEHRNPDNAEWKPGMRVADPLTGKPATVKLATIKEIEGTGAVSREGAPLTYHKNALVNTIDEALKVERVERNMDVLDELTKGMKAEGLAHQDEWRFKGEDGLMNVVRANTPRPEGFVELPQIPQLRGWSFDPRIAEVLKDYYPGPDEPLDSLLAKANRALNASLFITPFPHIKNVATMGFIGRGWDWIPGGGRYGRLARTSQQAIKEVLTLGPRYKEFLREGGGLMAGDEATRNFYQALLDSAVKGIEGNPRPLKAAGLNPVEAVKALYNVSHKILWNVNDMVMFQRYLELKDGGMSSRAAIKEAERWIANYRIPSQVMKSRAFRQFIADGKWINFGRYTYGKWKAIGEMARGLASKDPKTRMDALGKVVASGVMMLVIYPFMDQIAKSVTGNKNARFSRGGELAPVDAITEPGKDWAARMGSFATPAPALETGLEVANNRELYSGRQIVDPMASPKGQAVQAGEYAAGKFYPAQLGLESLRPGGAEQAAGRLFGVNLPQQAPGAMKGRTRKYLQSQAKRRERRDELESLIP